MGLIITLFASCGDGLKGTYVPKNEAAKQSMFSKFVFKGNKVKVVMGTAGIEIPGGHEYTFYRVGDKISIEMKVMGVGMGGIDLNYNKEKDELRLLFGGEVGIVLNEHAPVWIKEGKFNTSTTDSKPQKQNEAMEREISIQDRPAKRGVKGFISGIFGGKDKKKAGHIEPEEEQELPIETIKTVETTELSTIEEKKAEEVSRNKPIQASPSKPIPSVSQLNGLLKQIAESEDNAIDEMRKILGNNLDVNGTANISNVQQLITDVSNGTHYRVTNVNTNAEGKVVSITVSKQF